MTENKTILRRSFTVTAAHHNLSAEFLEPSTGDRTGNLSTLVFLHEGLGCIPMWRNFPSMLCEKTGCSALLYDRWGYGKSDPLPVVGPRIPSYLHEEALVTLPEVLNQCNIDDAILIGHSDGGSMALMFAGVYPDTVRGIITEAAHVFVEEITLKGICEAVEIYKRTDLKEKLTKYHGTNTEKMFYGWADTWLSPEFRDWNIEEFLPQIVSPLLVLQGADDIYGTPAQVEAITGHVAGPVKSWLVPNCGHIPHHEATEEVLNEMMDFICDLITSNHHREHGSQD